MPKIKPKLIHPVTCIIHPLKDRSQVGYDDDFKEPTVAESELYDSANPIEVKAQVSVFTWDELQAKLNGYDEKARGYLLVYRDDGDLIKKSDKIVSVDGSPVKDYIYEIRPVSFYQNGYHFYKLIFMSRDKGAK